MDTEHIVTTIIFGSTGLLFIGLALPLIRRRIPPNGLYGFRTPAAFTSDAVWYDVNEYAGRRLRELGIATLCILPILIAAGTGPSLFGLLLAGQLIIGVVVAFIRSYIYLNHRLTQ